MELLIIALGGAVLAVAVGYYLFHGVIGGWAVAEDWGLITSALYILAWIVAAPVMVVLSVLVGMSIIHREGLKNSWDSGEE